MAFNYDIEPAMEDALVAILGANEVTAGGSRTLDELSTPRAEVRFELGGEREIADPSNPQRNYIWDGQFIVTVVTDRDRNNASHSAFRATVRRLIAETVAADWEAQLGGSFRLLSLSHESTAYELKDAQKGLDASAMTYAATVEFLEA